MEVPQRYEAADSVDPGASSFRGSMTIKVIYAMYPIPIRYLPRVGESGFSS
jgi:hypothetical protein